MQSRLLENDELNEVSDLISVEEYFRGVYYLYWEDQRTLRKKIISAERDISAFEILPITHEIAVKATAYTGFAYVLTVLLLILPYLIIPNLYVCLGLTILDGILVILIFTYYVSVARELPFGKRFFEMTAVSLGVAGLTFIIGFLITTFLNVQV